MSFLRNLIKKNLILEKKIAQISSKIEIEFSFLIDRTVHAYLRRTRSDIEDYDTREISNDEIVYFIGLVRKKIAEKILMGEIIDGVPFVVRSVEKAMALAIVPKQEYGVYWKLIITTVFRESTQNPFRVGRDQLVIDV
jgi:hypothetical protein